MKNYFKIAIAVLFFALTSFSSVSTVYLCNSKSATKYHYTSNCRGLNACKAQIVAVQLYDARDRGYTLCGWED